MNAVADQGRHPHDKPALHVKPSTLKGRLHVEPTPRYYRFFVVNRPDQERDARPLFESAIAFLVWEDKRAHPVLALRKDELVFTKPGAGTGLVLLDSDKVREVQSEMISEVYALQIGDDAETYGAKHGKTSVSHGKIAGWSFDGSTLFTDSTSTDIPAPHHLVCLDPDAFPCVYEENQPLLGHVKDPFHRVDLVPSKQRVQIYVSSSNKETFLIADTDRCTRGQKPLALFETGFITRWYLPISALLVKTNDEGDLALSTGQVIMQPPPSCQGHAYLRDGLKTAYPDKSEARHHSLELPDGEKLEKVACSYPTAIRAFDVIGLICFHSSSNQRLKAVVDGEMFVE